MTLLRQRFHKIGLWFAGVHSYSMDSLSGSVVVAWIHFMGLNFVVYSIPVL